MGYYPCSTSYFHQCRLIVVSGDVQLSPHLNIRSLKNGAHCIQIKNLITKSNFEIFTLSETWLNELVRDSEIAISEYVLYRLDRLVKIRGGVCVFVKEFYKIKPLDKLSSKSNVGFDQFWLSVPIQNHEYFIICTAYCPQTVL